MNRRLSSPRRDDVRFEKGKPSEGTSCGYLNSPERKTYDQQHSQQDHELPARLKNLAYLWRCTNQSMLLCLPVLAVPVGGGQVGQSSGRNGPRGSTHHLQARIRQGAECPLEAPIAMQRRYRLMTLHDQHIQRKGFIPPCQDSRCQHCKSSQPLVEPPGRKIVQVECRDYEDMKRRQRQRLQNRLS
jgi:hypothetical protein